MGGTCGVTREREGVTFYFVSSLGSLHLVGSIFICNIIHGLYFLCINTKKDVLSLVALRPCVPHPCVPASLRPCVPASLRPCVPASPPANRKGVIREEKYRQQKDSVRTTGDCMNKNTDPVFIQEIQRMDPCAAHTSRTLQHADQGGARSPAVILIVFCTEVLAKEG